MWDCSATSSSAHAGCCACVMQAASKAVPPTSSGRSHLSTACVVMHSMSISEAL